MSRPFEEVLADKTGDPLSKPEPEVRIRFALPASAAATLMQKYREDPEAMREYFGDSFVGLELVEDDNPAASFCESDPISKPIRAISCGCCTNGCVCHNHMDIPRGCRPQKCAVHSGTRATVFLRA